MKMAFYSSLEALGLMLNPVKRGLFGVEFEVGERYDLETVSTEVGAKLLG